MIEDPENECSSSDSPPTSGPTPDPDLITDGWKYRFLADATRLQEAIDLYAELGYEVRSEPARTEGLKDECNNCKSAFCDFYMIYTRKR